MPSAKSDALPTGIQVSSVASLALAALEIVRASSSWKPAYQWLPSQNGLFLDAPQRQST